MKKTMIFAVMVMFVMLVAISCKDRDPCPTCPPIIEPPEDIYLTLEAKYQRINDNSACPLVYPIQNYCFFTGTLDNPAFLPPEGSEMKKTGEGLFQIDLPRVRVNYPYETYNFIGPHLIFIIDNAYFSPGREECTAKAHNLFLNGKLMEKIHRGGEARGWDFKTQGEWVLVRMDKHGEIYEVTE